MLSPDPLDVGGHAFWLRVGTALLCGGLVGTERQLRGKAAGVRTSILVCLGTAIFVALGEAFGPAGTDPSRVLGQVITGIGFLGAGVILAQGGRIMGVTSAAAIWVLAAIGAAIGLGRLEMAIALTGVTLLVLIGVELLETGWARLRTGSLERGFEHMEINE
jgi:putative Mg2+ transporter-C (MgtC) family protein